MGRIEVVLDLTATDTVNIVNELREMGLEQTKDFDFKFNQGGYRQIDEQDAFAYRWVEHTSVFYFYREELASWFKLKYMQSI